MTDSNQYATYRARWLLPITSAPIHDGVITLSDQTIRSVSSFAGQAVDHDLGDVAVMPGLVNAHTHLEFSDLEAPIGSAGMSIADWLPAVVRQRRAQNISPARRFQAICDGLKEAYAGGTRLLGEIGTRPWPIGEVAEFLNSEFASALKLTGFWEVLGLHESRSQDLLEWSELQLSEATSGVIEHGISPHAPYTVPLPLADACIKRAIKHHAPVAMHLAETLEERRLLESGDGPLRDAFEAWNLDGLDYFPQPNAIETLIQKIGDASRGLVVHGNYLNDSEITQISKRREKLSVIMCPRTHAYFGHSKHPVIKLQESGINVALGTDSRASNPDLDLWAEARHLLLNRQDLHPRSILEMATLCGAKALGRAKFGRLETGCDGNLLTFPCIASSEDSLWQSLSQAKLSPLS